MAYLIQNFTIEMDLGILGELFEKFLMMKRLMVSQ